METETRGNTPKLLGTKGRFLGIGCPTLRDGFDFIYGCSVQQAWDPVTKNTFCFRRTTRQYTEQTSTHLWNSSQTILDPSNISSQAVLHTLISSFLNYWKDCYCSTKISSISFLLWSNTINESRYFSVTQHELLHWHRTVISGTERSERVSCFEEKSRKIQFTYCKIWRIGSNIQKHSKLVGPFEQETLWTNLVGFCYLEFQVNRAAEKVQSLTVVSEISRDTKVS